MYMGYQVFLEYDRRLVPETAVSFLSAMLAAKLGSRSKNFQTELIIGLLWTGGFALFNNTLYYLFYLASFFFLTVSLLKENPDNSFKIRYSKIGLSPILNLLKTLPLIISLFFFFPRFRGFFPSANSSNSKSEVGYSKTIDNSGASSLRLSSKTAFYAETGKRLPQERLYWRGRVHTRTDGYNWKPESLPSRKSLPVGRGQSIQYTIKFEQDLDGDVALLDTPIKVLDSKSRYYEVGDTNTYRTYRKRKKTSVSAVSNLDGEIRTFSGAKLKNYLQLPSFRPKTLREFSERITETKPELIVRKFSEIIKTDSFSYTLSPGALPNLSAFIQAKKGFCTHYASLLGIVLRIKGVPARLVSGFQGGIYNEAGGFYTISSNDAHAWVEYHNGKVWKRTDPTGFISPERISQGGEQFLKRSTNSNWNASTMFPFIQDVEQWLSNINYKLALFFDDFDRDAQENIAKNLNLKLKQFYWMGAIFFTLLIVSLAILVYRRRSPKQLPEDKAFKSFAKKLEKKQIVIKDFQTEASIAKELIDKGIEDNYIEFLNLYQKIKYQQKSELVSKLKETLKNL